MNKNNVYLFFAIVPVLLLTTLSFSGGFTGSGKSGSPSDGSSCTQCHSGGLDTGISVAISTTIPVSGYTPGVTYQVTVNLTTSTSRNGFQLTAENSSNTKVGTFAARDANTQAVLSDKSITHTGTGNSQSSWTVDWTAPSTDQGDITFYVASVASNQSNNANGDVVVLASESVNTLGFNLLEGNPQSIHTLVLDRKLYFSVFDSSLANGTLELFDLSGKLIKRYSVNSAEHVIDLSSYLTGVYLVKYSSSEHYVTKKISVF